MFLKWKLTPETETHDWITFTQWQKNSIPSCVAVSGWFEHLTINISLDWFQVKDDTGHLRKSFSPKCLHLTETTKMISSFDALRRIKGLYFFPWTETQIGDPQKPKSLLKKGCRPSFLLMLPCNLTDLRWTTFIFRAKMVANSSEFRHARR